jgi:hypothetical protein
MDAILNLFQEHLKSNLNTWKVKRQLLHFIWGILNISFIIIGTNYMVVHNLEFVWFIVTMAYASIYWILSSLLIDGIIGDEIDHEIRS